ncbi:MAG: cold shock domain-containing protein [Deltaproteobacteria bacterium]|nr:cold shock domain-containing protein [Deltaproteobacteria bacterium]
MPTGKIKWFNPQIGAGFIRSDDGENIFFRSAVYKGKDAREIREGQPVRFDIAKNARTISQSATRVNGCH